MQKKLVVIATAVATIAVFAAACSKSSSNTSGTPTPGTFTLDSGTYSFTASSVPVNTCLSSSLNGVIESEAVTFNIDNTAGNGTFFLSATGTLAALLPTFQGTKTGNTIAGTGNVTLPVGTSGTFANGTPGCQLNVTATLPGDMVQDNTFNDTITAVITAAPVAGANCGSIKVENIFPLTLAAGTSSCNLSIAGQAAITASTAAFSLSNRY